MTTPYIEVPRPRTPPRMGGLPAPAGRCPVSDTRLAIRGMVSIIRCREACDARRTATGSIRNNPGNRPLLNAVEPVAKSRKSIETTRADDQT
jgi:hypothetical protein